MGAFLDEIDLLVRSRHAVLYVVTHEEGRLEDLLFGQAHDQGKKLFGWTADRGLYEYLGHHEPGKGIADMKPPTEVLREIQRTGTPAIYLLKDFPAFFDDPAVVRQLRDLAQDLRHKYQTVILSSPKLALPAELDKDVAVVDLPLPDAGELLELLRAVCVELRRSDKEAVALSKGDADALVQAAQGLTLSEAENAFAKAAVTRGVLDRKDVELVLSEKQQVIRKSGLLEFHPPDTSMQDVGGLEALKQWLLRRGKAWEPKARAFGLPAPRGVLLLGVPGCGKSLTARAVAQAWKLPLLHLDLGRVFGGLLGSSEENMRKALRVADGVAPAVLWIDEIEKGLAGGMSSGQSDSGTAIRVFGTLLTWMQERAGEVFVVATANRIEQLPPELLRRGRFDEIFFVDLPDACARAEILGIHLRKRRREPSGFDLGGLAKASEGYSGAELESCVQEALFAAYDNGRDLENEDLLAAIDEVTPLSVTSAEDIARLRAWASTRARSADPSPEEVGEARG
ncbi:MAG: AAA family ATPase [Proteobacteria bacterium]|nr:AAA family ATPase [Pseudomonadota bacterium]